MSESWRLLDFGEVDIFTMLAIDEAILTCVMERDSPNTLRFARFRPPVVSLGYFQVVEEEIDSDACKRIGIDVSRRLIGGGAAYEDYRGEMTYGVCVNLPHPRVPMNFIGSYKALSAGVIAGLKKLGVQASFAGINDVVVNGRKIGGVGQCRFRDTLLQEGSVLFDSMPEMFKVLRISKSKMQEKGFSTPEDRMTNVRRELGGEIKPEILRDALVEGFQEALRIVLHIDELSDREKNLSENLVQKYRSHEWIYKR